MSMKPKYLALLLIPLLTLRVAWGAWPSIWLCAAFWLSAVTLAAVWADLLAQRAIHPRGLILVGVGAALNGTVMVANDGYMPVIGKPEGFQTAIWVSAETHGNLLFLADRMALGGVSPGDIFIGIGMLVSLAAGIAHWRVRRALRIEARPASSPGHAPSFVDETPH